VVGEDFVVERLGVDWTEGRVGGGGEGRFTVLVINDCVYLKGFRWEGYLRKSRHCTFFLERKDVIIVGFVVLWRWEGRKSRRSNNEHLYTQPDAAISLGRKPGESVECYMAIQNLRRYRCRRRRVWMFTFASQPTSALPLGEALTQP
jgi:hypothetical protein